MGEQTILIQDATTLRVMGTAREGDTVFFEITSPLREGQQTRLAEELSRLSERTGIIFVLTEDGLHVERITPADAHASLHP